MYKIIKLTIICCWSTSFYFAQDVDRLLDPNFHDVWTVEDLGYKELIAKSINDFINGNPIDSLPKIETSHRMIIVVRKTNSDEIFQLRYGVNKPYQILNNTYVQWALSQTLRKEILGGDNERLDYYHINNKTYITNSLSLPEQEYLYNRDNWSLKDVYVSLGNPFFDRVDLKAGQIEGAKILKIFALTMRSGEELLGFPNSTQGHMRIGLLNTSFETGIQLPKFAQLVPRIGVAEIDSGKVLSGGIGGYTKLNLFDTQFSLSFSGLSESQWITDNLDDSTYINHMNYSFMVLRGISSRSIGKYGLINVRAGYGLFEISHKSLLPDGSFINRMKNRKGDPLVSHTTKYMGPMMRFDYVSKVRKNSSLPLLELFAQFNLYSNYNMAIGGLSLNFNQIGFDVKYKQSQQSVDWEPKAGVFVSFNWYYNKKNN